MFYLILNFFFFLCFFVVYRILKLKRIYKIPTKRGLKKTKVLNCGGISVFINFTVIFIYFILFQNHSEIELIFISLAIIFIVSLIDDLRNLNIKLRLFFQFLSSIFFIIYFHNIIQTSSIILNFSLIFLIVWFINFYNFMDGADGFISLIYIFSLAILLSYIHYFDIRIFSDFVIFPLLAIVPFALFNFNPSKIILGDCGSTVLGLYSAFLFIHLLNLELNYALGYLCLINPLFIDAVITLLVRIKEKKNIFKAHKTHLYQKIIIQKGYSYFYFFYLKLCFFWFLPMSFLIFNYNEFSIIFYLISILPMIYFHKNFTYKINERII